MKFKNLEVFPIMHFLLKIDMNAKASRSRTKLAKRLEVWGDEYVESQKQIVIENGGTVDKNGNVDFNGDEAKLEKATLDRIELSNECISVQEDFIGQFKCLKDFFDAWDGDVSPIDAPAYDVLLDKLEETEEK